MSQLFISYSRQDRDQVDRLVRDCEDAGYDVWVDREDLRGGDKWREGIVAAVRSCRAFLIVLSPNSVQSDNVRRELDIGVDAKARIIPIVLEETQIPEQLEYQLAGLQRIQFNTNREAGFDELLVALGGRKRKRGTVLRGAVFGGLIGVVLSLVVGSSDSIWRLLTQDFWQALEKQGFSTLRTLDFEAMPKWPVVSILCAAGLACGALFSVRWRIRGGIAIGLFVGVVWSVSMHYPVLYSASGLIAQAAEPRTAVAPDAAHSTPPIKAAAVAQDPAAIDRWRNWKAAGKLVAVCAVLGGVVGALGVLLRLARFTPLVVGE